MLKSQKEHLDKLKDDYIVKLNKLQSFAGKEAEEYRVEVEQMEKRIKRKEPEYYEAEKKKNTGMEL